MINVEKKDSTTIQLNLEGEITGEDYKKIKHELEAVFKKNGRQKFIFNMNQATKFTLGAVLQDIKFDLQHLKFIGTTAVVSTKPMAETFTDIVDSIYPVKIERFDDVSSASQWLRTQDA